MNLNLNDDTSLDDPSDAQLRAGIAELEDEQYAILSSGDEVYVQVYRHGASDFQLEYRDGSADKHFGAAKNDLPIAQIQDVFSAFLMNSPDWNQGVDWEKLEL